MSYTSLSAAGESSRLYGVSPLTQTVLANLSVYALICNSIVCWRHMIKYMYKHGTTFFLKLLFTFF